MAKDFFGNEINIGDTVAFMEIGYRSLKTGIVESISEKMVIIKHEKYNTSRIKTRQDHNQVIVKK